MSFHTQSHTETVASRGESGTTFDLHNDSEHSRLSETNEPNTTGAVSSSSCSSISPVMSKKRSTRASVCLKGSKTHLLCVFIIYYNSNTVVVMHLF